MSFPFGLIQVRVGVGKPSEKHFKVTFCPIQDLGTDEVMDCMVAVSVEQMNS